MHTLLVAAACLLLALVLGCQPAARDQPAAASKPAAAAPAAPAAAQPAAAQPAVPPGPPRKVTVAFVSPSEVFAIPWIAKEAGFFLKYGFDAEVPLVTGSPRLTQSLIAGDFDYALPGVTALMRARMQGADPVILAASTNYSTQQLFAQPTSGIRRVEDLRGRTVGVAQYGSEAESFLLIVLGKLGIPADAVTVLQTGGHPQTLAAMLSGSLEAGVLGGANGVAALQAGIPRIADAKDLNVLAPSGTLATTRRHIERDREGVQRFMRAYVEAVHFFKTNREDSIRIMQQYMAGLPADEVGLVYDSVRDLYAPLPLPSEEAIQAVLERETDPEAKNYKPGDFVDLSFLREIEQSGLLKSLYQ